MLKDARVTRSKATNQGDNTYDTTKLQTKPSTFLLEYRIIVVVLSILFTTLVGIISNIVFTHLISLLGINDIYVVFINILVVLGTFRHCIINTWRA